MHAPRRNLLETQADERTSPGVQIFRTALATRYVTGAAPSLPDRILVTAGPRRSLVRRACFRTRTPIAMIKEAHSTVQGACCDVLGRRENIARMWHDRPPGKTALLASVFRYGTADSGAISVG